MQKEVRAGQHDRAAQLPAGGSTGVKPSSIGPCWPCRKRRCWEGIAWLGLERVLIESADLSGLAQCLLKVRCRQRGSPRCLVCDGFLDHTM